MLVKRMIAYTDLSSACFVAYWNLLFYSSLSAINRRTAGLIRRQRWHIYADI